MANLSIEVAVSGGLPNCASADIADAAEKLTRVRSHMTSAIRLMAGEALSGPAVTVQLVKDGNVSALALGLEVVRIIESAPADSVLVMAVDDGVDSAAFGAVLAVLMKACKSAGLVLDGSLRDLAELRRMAFPVFARGSVAGSAGGHYKLQSVNQTLTCGGVTVSPGDLIVGDQDGVAVAPQARQAEIVDLARKIQAEETELVKRIAAAGSYLKMTSGSSDTK